jgi:high-affinity nickel-transport protein
MIDTSGLALMFLLGLRHGLDPDHIACIDGLTWRAVRDGAKNARWIGSMFALGHGMLVTCMAVIVNRLAHAFALPEVVWSVLEWGPTVLLLLVGTINLRLLMRPAVSYAPTGWKMRLIPRRLRDSTSPWAIILIGILFATVFDTATQASAWGYVATNRTGGHSAALIAGIVFTLGMIVTDTLDSHIVCHVVKLTASAEAGQRYRRRLGWMIVAMAYGVAAYNLSKTVLPGVELNDTAFTLVGLLFVLAMMSVAVAIRHGRQKRQASLHMG